MNNFTKNKIKDLKNLYLTLAQVQHRMSDKNFKNYKVRANFTHIDNGIKNYLKRYYKASDKGSLLIHDDYRALVSGTKVDDINSGYLTSMSISLGVTDIKDSINDILQNDVYSHFTETLATLQKMSEQGLKYADLPDNTQTLGNNYEPLDHKTVYWLANNMLNDVSAVLYKTINLNNPKKINSYIKYQDKMINYIYA